MQRKAPLIPMEDFFRNPEKSSFSISPNGNYIAYMKPWKTRMNVFVMEIITKKETRLTSSQERGVYGFTWLTNKRIGYVILFLKNAAFISCFILYHITISTTLGLY